MSAEKPETPIRNEAQAVQRAKFHAALIIESALDNGWGSDAVQIDKYGTQGAALVEKALAEVADNLMGEVRLR